MQTEGATGLPLWFSASLRQVERRYAGEPLMERAGEAAATLAKTLIGDDSRPVLFLAGPGNNGGDAFVAARRLHAQGIAVAVVFAGEARRLPPDAAVAFRRLAETLPSGQWHTTFPSGDWSLIVDGLFGIGLARPPEGIYAELIERANACDGSQKLALDCPSGLDADTGCALGERVFAATHTLSFLGAKPGLFTADGPDCCGLVSIAELAVPVARAVVPDGRLVTPADFSQVFTPRANNSHKGAFGTLGVLGGASGMNGALLLAGRAALHLGAGRVLLGFLDREAPAVDGAQPELMLRPPETLFEVGLDALACGPGMGQSDLARDLLARALTLPLPLVLDADALNLLAADAALASLQRARTVATLLTPHPAEAARLLACRVADVQQNRIEAAKQLARDFRAQVILKGCGSIIAAPQGDWRLNPFGNPGLATAGSGDVLTGIAAAFLAQGISVREAAQAACCLHGLAAERLTAAGVGPVGLTAGELIPAARAALNAGIGDRQKK